jgi:hypothetical protein
MSGLSDPWLEDEQKELLATLVRAHNDVPRESRTDFALMPSLVRTKGVISREKVREATHDGVVGYGSQIIRSEDELPPNWDVDLIAHDGLERSLMQVLIGDLGALRLQGLVDFRDDEHFFVTPAGLRYAASMKQVGSPSREEDELTQDRPNPKVFISYTWESDEHKAWVREFAERLTEDGVAVTLDQWEIHPGDQMPAFMERSVRENDYVLVVCTPTYKRKSNNREGGAGYEGDIITGEIVNGGNRRKFIPVHRLGTWPEAAPSWLAAAYYISLTGERYDEGKYNDLINTLHGLRPAAPRIGPAPSVARLTGTTTSAPARDGSPVAQPLSHGDAQIEPIRILNVIVDEVTRPRNDGTRGSGLYTVPFQLSREPSALWAEVFVQTWNNPPEFSSMHRPGISRVFGSKILLEGTTVEEVDQYHKKTLKLAVARTNEIIDEHERKERTRLEAERQSREERERSIRESASRITFDD